MHWGRTPVPVSDDILSLPLTLCLSVVGLYCGRMKGPVALLSGLISGITHMVFSYCGNLLYTGERKVQLLIYNVADIFLKVIIQCTSFFIVYRQSSNLICWDIRNPGTILYNCQRVVNTNQRIYFDVSRLA